MHGFYIEERTLPPGVNLSRDLAQHIFMRGAKGCVVVATNQPHDLQSITKKQWNALIRLVERERASTLKSARITELSNQIAWMQRLHFTSKLSDEWPENAVVFATPTELLASPPLCSTLYFTSTLDTERFYLLTSWLPNRSIVVIYRVSRQASESS